MSRRLYRRLFGDGRGQRGVGAQEDEHVVKAEAVRPVLVVTMPVTIVAKLLRQKDPSWPQKPLIPKL